MLIHFNSFQYFYLVSCGLLLLYESFLSFCVVTYLVSSCFKLFVHLLWCPSVFMCLIMFCELFYVNFLLAYFWFSLVLFIFSFWVGGCGLQKTFWRKPFVLLLDYPLRVGFFEEKEKLFRCCTFLKPRILVGYRWVCYEPGTFCIGTSRHVNLSNLQIVLISIIVNWPQ